VCRGHAAKPQPRGCEAAATRLRSRGEATATRQSHGHAAKPRPRGEAAALRARGEAARGKAASCRGKAARGKAAYNLVIIKTGTKFETAVKC